MYIVRSWDPATNDIHLTVMDLKEIQLFRRCATLSKYLRLPPLVELVGDGWIFVFETSSVDSRFDIQAFRRQCGGSMVRVQPTLPQFVVIIIVVSGPTNTTCHRQRPCFSGRRKSCLEQSATRRHISFDSRCFPKAPQNISVLTLIHCLTLFHLCPV